MLIGPHILSRIGPKYSSLLYKNVTPDSIGGDYNWIKINLEGAKNKFKNKRAEIPYAVVCLTFSYDRSLRGKSLYFFPFHLTTAYTRSDRVRYSDTQTRRKQKCARRTKVDTAARA